MGRRARNQVKESIPEFGLSCSGPCLKLTDRAERIVADIVPFRLPSSPTGGRTARGAHQGTPRGS